MRSEFFLRRFLCLCCCCCGYRGGWCDSCCRRLRSSRRCRIVLAIFGLGCLLFWLVMLHHSMEPRDLSSLLLRGLVSEGGQPSAWPSRCPANATCISVATPAFGGNAYWRMVLDSKEVAACAADCKIVSEPSEAHGLLFHAFDLPSRRRLRFLRASWPRRQLWIYYSLESPVHLATNQCVRDCDFAQQPLLSRALAFAKEFVFPSYLLRKFPDTTEEAAFFNWTVTYRRDSTVYSPYGRFIPLNESRQELKVIPQPAVPLTEKRHLSFIVVSNCRPYNRRQEILAKLAQHMELHVYGRCGDRQVPSGMSIQQLSRRYYFHLSFENAFCRDYITEKFFVNGLSGFAVPVAFGGLSRRDYEAVAPPNSFLYASDFQSPLEMARRLQHLAESPQEYAAYHQWRKTHGWVEDKTNKVFNLFCQICRKLRRRSVAATNSVESHTRLDLNRFYDSGRQCRHFSYDPFAADPANITSNRL